MADKKISQLTTLAQADVAPTADFLPIVDTGSTETKKATPQSVVNAVLNAATTVGVGTTTPAYPMHVVNAANGIVAAQGGSGTNQGGAFFVRNAAGSGTIYAFGDRARVFGGTPESVASIFTSTQPLTFDVNSAERARIDASGNLGIGTASPSALLDVNSDTMRLRTARTPASATAAGNAGDICWDATYLYICTATNTWRRILHATW